MVVIKGIQKTSLIDYPGKICTVLFTAGCNMHCPFCQNPDLILNPDKMPELDEEKIISFLKKRKKWVDGVCVTGGEPLIYEDILDLIRKIKKETGLLVKVDTNGLNPKLLKKIIDEKIVDYIAMDIKSDIKHYSQASGVKTDIDKIKESIEIIKNSGIDYEFRSTVVPDFFNEKIIENIGKWLKGSKRYFLQQFRSSLPLLDKRFEGKQPYKEEVLKKFKGIASKYIEEVETRD
jgi:pyruvate formate lyase activating enzyme